MGQRSAGPRLPVVPQRFRLTSVSCGLSRAPGNKGVRRRRTVSTQAKLKFKAIGCGVASTLAVTEGTGGGSLVMAAPLGRCGSASSTVSALHGTGARAEAWSGHVLRVTTRLPERKLRLSDGRR